MKAEQMDNVTTKQAYNTYERFRKAWLSLRPDMEEPSFEHCATKDVIHVSVLYPAARSDRHNHSSAACETQPNPLQATSEVAVEAEADQRRSRQATR